MTVATVTKSNRPKAQRLFHDEIADQLIAQVSSKDTESILCESGWSTR